MEKDDEILKEYYSLADFIFEKNDIEDIDKYKKDFSAFALHVRHSRAYDFIAKYCSGKKVLDVGCFIGYGESHIANYAKEIVAIDADSKAINYARSHNKFHNVKFEITDAKKMPFPDKSFDVVIAFQLIEHIPVKKVSDFIRDSARLLKEGGLFLVATPNRKFRLRPLQQPTNIEHYQEFTAEHLLKSLKEYFTKVEIKGIRAEKWIEDIEKERVKTSLFRAYAYLPAANFISKKVSLKNIMIMKKIFNMIPAFSKNKKTEKENENENENNFDCLLKKFDNNVFYLDDKKPDNSMELIAICKNE